MGQHPRGKGAAAVKGGEQAGMKKRKAVRILLCQQEPVRTGERFHLDVQVRVPVECRLLEIEANVEGRCRAAFEGHDNLQTLVQQPLDLRPLSNYVSKGDKEKGKEKHPKDDQSLVIPAGIHRVVCPVVLPQELPGTFKAKYGAIAYRAIVKVRIAPFPKGDEIILEGDKTIDVLGSIALDSFPRHDAPVLVDQHFVKSFLCFSRLDVKVNAEIERSAYRTGEHVLVSGTIENGQPSTVLKNVNIELRQLTHYTNGTTKKSDDRLIASLACGTCDINSALKLHHSLQIPANVFPSLVNPNSAVQVFYELHITGNGEKFRVEVPLFVGNRTASSTAASSGGRKSRPVSGVFTRSGCSSYCSSYGEDTTYSSGSDERECRSEDFVRVHAPPPPPFMPAYGIRQMPTFFAGAPPRYGSHHHPPPPPAYKPFLKIEEITDD
ncbi:hypothetical protein PENTCL1PPCAC_5748 [Pristionchus entomophagus]|uniref:Arrestin C-terminal-like domain-containing protein n=1 Tax=Pristionchus entomophagus TaxID=358040 RepID=A0AAV5SN89_9BILA|nr:hypothetical protein PENTCL1PPCAC_5748 [Pristionchus entomophagus]